MGGMQKDRLGMAAGLGMAVIGGVWFALAALQVLEGSSQLIGFFLGGGLVISGPIMAVVYYFRTRRIQNLVEGEDVLVKWINGENQVIIAPDCAYVNGELYAWGIAGARLEEVQIECQEFYGSQQAYLQITFSEMTNARSPITRERLWKTRKLSIRIPEGGELAAQTALVQIQSRVSARQDTG